MLFASASPWITPCASSRVGGCPRKRGRITPSLRSVARSQPNARSLGRRGSTVNAFRLILLVTLLAPQSVGARDSSTKPKAEVQGFRSATWTEVRRLADIDPVVMRALQEHMGKGTAFADVGGAFDATDIVTGKPRRRLVFGGYSGERWFICYEKGGRGHHLVLVVFDKTGDVLRPVLLARGGAGKHDDIHGWRVDLADLRRALSGGELKV